MRAAAHACDMETVKIHTAAVICEYTGSYREERDK